MEPKRVDYSEVLNESVYHYELKKGLKVYVMPKKGFNQKYVYWGTYFGGAYTSFLLKGKKIHIPMGTAHFLEHQIFENPIQSSFEQFEKIGSSINASTGHHSTLFFFQGMNHMKKNIALLMDMVQNARISKNTVEKERNIILRESEMVFEKPERVLIQQLLESLYHHHPIKNSIIGDASSIQNINEEILRFSFDCFYTPDNMPMFVYGDVCVEDVLESIDKHLILKKANSEKKIKKYFEAEPLSVKRSYVAKQMCDSPTLFSIGFKASPVPKYLNVYRMIASIKVANDMMFGQSSEFFKKCFLEGWVTEAFDIDIQVGEGYAYCMIGNESENSEKLKEEIFRTIDHHLKNGFTTILFESARKKRLGRFLFSYNALQSLANGYTYNAMKGLDLFEQIKAYQSLTLETIMTAMHWMYQGGQNTISVVHR